MNAVAAIFGRREPGTGEAPDFEAGWQIPHNAEAEAGRPGRTPHRPPERVAARRRYRRLADSDLYILARIAPSIAQSSA